MAEKRIKIQVNIDLTTQSVLLQMEKKHLLGHGISQNAAAILQQWIWANRKDLKEEGIHMVDESVNKPE
jgi:hypothetical protein